MGNGATLWGEGQQLWVPGGGPWGSLLMGGGVLIGVGSGDFLLLRGSSRGLCLLGRGGKRPSLWTRRCFLGGRLKEVPALQAGVPAQGGLIAF